MTIKLDSMITKALQLIAREHERKAAKYEPEHDDSHNEGEMAQAAAVYAALSASMPKDRANVRPNDGWKPSPVLAIWPFDELPKLAQTDDNLARLQDLVKAGNLIVSEIARRLRLP